MNVEFTSFPKLGTEQAARWTAYWEATSHAHPRQHPKVAAIDEDIGRRMLYVLGARGGRVACVGAFSFRRAAQRPHLPLELVCRRGPVFDDPEVGRACLGHVIEYARAHGFGRLRVSPYWLYPDAVPVERMLSELGFVTRGRSGTPREHTGFIDLQRSDEKLLAGFSKNARQQVHTARNKGVLVVSPRNLDEARAFGPLYQALHRERGLTELRPDELTATFERLFRFGELATALHAVHDGRLLGGLWLFRSHHTLHGSQYAIAKAEARDGLPSGLSIGPLLWYHAMLWGRDRGCRSFNVEGYVEPELAEPALRHVYSFKRRLRPVRGDIIAEHAVVTNRLLSASMSAATLCHRITRRVRSIPLPSPPRGHAVSSAPR